MKTAFSILAGRCLGLLALLLGLTVAQAQVPPPAGPVTYQTFYDALSPYGQWVNDPDYGYMWVPTAGADFQPYRTNGHWVYTDYGWTWVSDYAWGWAPFHYGRWRFADGYGWVWVPGYSWGPAWVAWRQSAGYYGWAPLGPPPVRSGVRVNIGLSFSFGDAPVVPARWCFVPAAYVASPRLATYYVPPARTTVVYNQTTVIHNTYLNKQVNNTTIINNNDGGRRGGGGFPAGPARASVEQATGHPIQQVNVTNRATPGVGVQGRSLAFYRPSVVAPSTSSRRGGAGSGPAPRQVVSLPDAARQARAAQPTTADGLQRNQAAQQLSSSDAHPFRDAQAAARQQPAAGATPAAAGPPLESKRGGRLASGQGADQPATSAAASPDQQSRQQQQPARLGQQPQATAADQAARQQLREQQRLQNQQARQQQMQQSQANQQLRQQQQTQRQQNQLARQQRQQEQRPQERPQPRGGGGERRR